MSRSAFGRALASTAAILVSTIAPALAADSEEEVIVTGRFATKQTASSVTVITANDLERRQVTSVLQALRGAPGISSNQSGGAGQIATVRLRGANSGQTLTLIDGVPVNDTTSTSGYNFAFLDSNVVERIEILRGSGSAIWGSDSIGGVINVVTFEPGQDSAKAYAEGGAFSTGRIGARVAKVFGPLTTSGYASAFDTGGISAADEDDGYTERDGADSVTLGGRAVWTVGNGFSFQYGARTTQGHSEFDEDTTFVSPTGNGDAESFYHSRENLNDARLTWAASDAMEFNLSASQSLTKTSSVSELFGPFRVRAERQQVRATGEFDLSPDQTLLVGGEHSKLIALTSFAADAEVTTSAGFATYQGRFFDKLLLEGGVRYENDERYGGYTTGRVGAALDAWQGGVVRATFGNSFRAPTVFETNGLPFKLPNFDLDPEAATEWEIGIEQSLLDGNLRLGLVYFDRETKDLITGTGFPTFVNVGRADSKGVEATLEGTIGALDLDLAYTYNEATRRDTGAQLDRVPRHSGSADLTWNATDKLSLGANLVWNGKENDFNFGLPFEAAELDSWTTLDLRAAYDLSDNVRLYGRVENALDEEYQDAFSYGTPGVAGYAGIRVKM